MTGGTLDFLLTGIQLAEADVVCYGSGKKVSILKDNAQGAAQVILPDVCAHQYRHR